LWGKRFRSREQGVGSREKKLVIPARFWRDCEGRDAEANGEADPKGKRQDCRASSSVFALVATN
jgi:hypothetical protein